MCAGPKLSTCGTNNWFDFHGIGSAAAARNTAQVTVQVATPQFLARVPVQDLLRQDQKDGWRASSTDGLSMQLQSGVLQIDNGAPAV